MIDDLASVALCEVIEGTVAELRGRKINKCVIEFETNPSKIYYTGETILGKVHLHLNEKVFGVSLKINGVARTRIVHVNNEYRSKPKICNGKEYFFDERVSLIGRRVDDLLPGSYQYSFKYKLPADLPTSLEYTSGCIRYKAIFIVENSLCPNEKFEELFSVIRVVELNPQMLEPVVSRHNQTFYLFAFICCVESEPLKIVMEISAGGFLPRQTIHLHLNVKNKSDQPVSEFLCDLIQKIKFKVDGDSKSNTNVLAKETIQGCDSGKEMDANVDFLVPTVPPNQLHSICKIIKIEYFVRILGSTPMLHPNFELCFPIKIGSKPIEDNPALPPFMAPIANDF